MFVSVSASILIYFYPPKQHFLPQATSFACQIFLAKSKNVSPDEKMDAIKYSIFTKSCALIINMFSFMNGKFHCEVIQTILSMTVWINVRNNNLTKYFIPFSNAVCKSVDYHPF